MPKKRIRPPKPIKKMTVGEAALKAYKKKIGVKGK